jgi:hypothetical protein
VGLLASLPRLGIPVPRCSGWAGRPEDLGWAFGPASRPPSDSWPGLRPVSRVGRRLTPGWAGRRLSPGWAPRALGWAFSALACPGWVIPAFGRSSARRPAGLPPLQRAPVIAGTMAPEKSWCLVECPARWEPQEEGVMNTAARFFLS